ncbi:MAG: hypothetical protein M1820_003429 [Bogoriella megaspora]|nr:MAG: hypothetical protein M1820_003429 [Bogoriella megaspora]
MTIRNGIYQLPKRISITYKGIPLLSLNGITVASRAWYSSSVVPKSGSRFTYRIAASYSGKGQKLDPLKNVYDFNPINTTSMFSGPQGNGKGRTFRPASGQDSFFVSNVGNTGEVAFGVADGVGGWVDSGIDPADFAHSLCNYMRKSATGYPNGFKEQPIRPKDILQIGYSRVMKDDTVIGGGSTACIATASKDGKLHVANLGDSGFLHLRANAVKFASPAQTHAFNTPYQLSKIPRQMLVQEAVFGVTRYSETPKDADTTTHSLSHGDIVIFASDGVWDNLSPEDTLTIASRQMLAEGAWTETENEGVVAGDRLGYLTYTPSEAEGRKLQERLATLITREAKIASLDMRRDGPFAKEVQRRYPNEDFRGGKMDDIVVVVAIVLEERF